MSNKKCQIGDWEKFREEILRLLVIKNHIDEYNHIDENQIRLIESFYFLSKEYTISAFFIKLGFLLKNGKPTFKDFLSDKDYSIVFELYQGKIKNYRDYHIAHNLKSKYDKEKITNTDVNSLYEKILEYAKKIDKSFNSDFHYEFVSNSAGINSIRGLIDDSLELMHLKEKLIKNNLTGLVNIDLKTGKISLQEK